MSPWLIHLIKSTLWSVSSWQLSTNVTSWRILSAHILAEKMQRATDTKAIHTRTRLTYFSLLLYLYRVRETILTFCRIVKRRPHSHEILTGRPIKFELNLVWIFNLSFTLLIDSKLLCHCTSSDYQTATKIIHDGWCEIAPPTIQKFCLTLVLEHSQGQHQRYSKRSVEALQYEVWYKLHS